MKRTPYEAIVAAAARTADHILSIDEFIAALTTPAPAAPAADDKPAADGKPATTNQYGVKVGDLFVSSWGYEQTNVDYYQVVSVHGKSSVRVREVRPQLVSVDGICGISQNVTIEIPRGEMLPYSDRSCSINDQERGDLKRVKAYGDSVSITIHGGYETAFLQRGDRATFYESWGY